MAAPVVQSILKQKSVGSGSEQIDKVVSHLDSFRKQNAPVMKSNKRVSIMENYDDLRIGLLKGENHIFTNNNLLQ